MCALNTWSIIGARETLMSIHTYARPKTILLAEDQPEVLNVYQRLLINTGCKALTARNGFEAFKTFELNRDSIDLIITDYDMPEWNGLKFIRAVRNLDAEVPILMITGFAESIVLQEANRFGVDILYKPVSLSVLAEIILASDHASLERPAESPERQEIRYYHAA